MHCVYMVMTCLRKISYAGICYILAASLFSLFLSPFFSDAKAMGPNPYTNLSAMEVLFCSKNNAERPISKVFSPRKIVEVCIVKNPKIQFQTFVVYYFEGNIYQLYKMSQVPYKDEVVAFELRESGSVGSLGQKHDGPKVFGRLSEHVNFDGEGIYLSVEISPGLTVTASNFIKGRIIE
jgi:hypothetical protein